MRTIRSTLNTRNRSAQRTLQIYPFSATDRDVYAVVGGWGISIYEGEWEDHPESEHIAFTLANAEPYYSVRRLSNGHLVTKAIIT